MQIACEFWGVTTEEDHPESSLNAVWNGNEHSPRDSFTIFARVIFPSLVSKLSCKWWISRLVVLLILSNRTRSKNIQIRRVKVFEDKINYGSLMFLRLLLRGTLFFICYFGMRFFLTFLLSSFATLLVVLYLEFGLDSSRFNLNYRIPWLKGIRIWRPLTLLLVQSDKKPIWRRCIMPSSTSTRVTIISNPP